MAGCSGELLAVLTGTLLLLGSVRGWHRINETQLISLYKTGHWSKFLSGWLPDKPENAHGSAHTVPVGHDEEEEDDDDDDDLDDDLDDDDDLTDDIVPPQTFGTGLTSLETAGESYFDVEGDLDLASWPGFSESEFQVEFEDPSPRSRPGSKSSDSAAIKVICRKDEFHITFLGGRLNDVNILGSNNPLPAVKAPKSCGYIINVPNKTLTVPFTGCRVAENSSGYSLQLLYIDTLGETQTSTVSCALSSGLPTPEEVEPRCCANHGVPVKPPPPLPASPKAQNCVIKGAEQLPCGNPGMSHEECDKMGCCMDMTTGVCYYPMDECTVDHNFVFAIRSGDTGLPVDPTQLVIPGHPHCKPAIVNDEVAIFRFKVNECGVHAYEVGEMKIYLAEVQTRVKALNLKYGIITRSDPVRFLVECRYSKCTTTKQSVASVGYLVKTPTSSLPSSVLSHGLFGVQLRIARDHTYSSYFPTYHQPLRLLLGKPVFLELLLKSPKPDAVLLVNYCVAYPRSARNALVLVFEGCANPYDPNVAILKVSSASQNRFQRRFVVNAFQFMETRTNDYLNEEIYFMCSTEVCHPTEKLCEEQCFDDHSR